MESIWCICGLYNEVHKIDGKEYAWGTQRFLCVEDVSRAWYYEEIPTNALKFTTKEEADAYIDKHNMRNGKGCNVFDHFAVEVMEF